MNNLTASQGNGSLPSPAQLALAMAIVKQKPADMDIREYVLQLRSSIQAAKEPTSNPVATSQDKFFDSVSFWQQAYERSEAEQSKLLDRIYELEQRNAALLTKAPTGGVGEEEGGGKMPESAKRRANPKTAAGGAASRKRAKTQALGQGAGVIGGIHGQEGILDMIDYVEESTGSFMRHFYTLQRILQKRPSRSSIVQAAASLANAAAESLLSSVCEKKVAGRSKAVITLRNKDPEIMSVIHSVDCAVQLLYQALGKISVSKEAVPDAGLVTYHIVRVYEAAMQALERYCKARSEQTQATKPNPKSTKQKQSAKSKRPEQKPDDEVAVQITRLLGSMTLSLDISFAEHRSLLEGALFILLHRVGRLLCLFVFQDLQLHPDLHSDPSKLPLPEGLQDVQINEKSLYAAKVESKHLIWVLERVLGYLEANTPSPSSESFISKVKERLRSTLLQAIFGADDQCFANSLQAPTLTDVRELERLRACVKVPEQTVPEWFVQEVWRLLGWEVLNKG